MPANSRFRCRTCGQWHEGPPLAFGWDAPAYWTEQLATEPLNVLEPEICIIKDQGFFVRGLIEIPIVGTADAFTWNVWVSLSKDNFFRTIELWEQPDRETQPAYFGWLSTKIPAYTESTLNLKTNLSTRPPGQRPLIVLEPTEHPLAVEQRNGMSQDRVQEIAAGLLHAE